MAIRTELFLALFFILVCPAMSFAGLIPEDEPCRLEGTFEINSTNAPNSIDITLTATVDSIEYKSITSDGSGQYVMTVGGSDGDTIALSVCGIAQNTTTLTPYGIKTVNINVALQANGVYGCTCDQVCSGGHCVNPGVTTGVCSANTYYCDSDGSCDSAYGETTTTCSADCKSGGGPSGGSSSSSTTSSCTSSWNCGAWEPAMCPATGIQTRTCIDINNCTGASQPVTTRSCTYVAPPADLESRISEFGFNDSFTQEILSDLEPMQDMISDSDNFDILNDSADIAAELSDELLFADTSANNAMYAAVFDTQEKSVEIGELSDNLRDQIINELKDELGIDYPTLADQTQVKKKAEVTTFKTKDGQLLTVVKFEYAVQIGDYVVNVPKTVAGTADEIFGNFNVIEMDPVLLFKDTDLISFSIVTEPSKVSDLESRSDEVAISEVKEVSAEDVTELPKEPGEEIKGIDGITGMVPAEAEEKASLLIGMIVIIVVVVGGLLGIVAYRSLLPKTSEYYFTKASKLHRKADGYYRKGNTTKAKNLFSKGQIMREKGERLLR